jgi:hypothetical protein
MKKVTFFDFMNQKKPFSHVSFMAFSLTISIIAGLSGKFGGSLSSFAGTFILVFCQLEVFIYIGHKLFASLNFDLRPGEITRIVVLRFFVFISGCLLSAMILYILLQYAFALIMGKELSQVLIDFIHVELRGWFKSTITGLSGGALIFIILLWQSSLQREQKLREEKLIFQNETLKNQVNPHFLFNSLNTLSSLVSSEPAIAEEFITRLASIYRYILENGSKDRVPLDVEISFIRDYFYLHKIRDNGKIRLDIKIDNTPNFEILPVSLQILVENAIKHNKATRENPLIIEISIDKNFVIVSNNLQLMAVQLQSTKIGLKNLAQRLSLTSGKAMIIQETNTDFTVKIPLL